MSKIASSIFFVLMWFSSYSQELTATAKIQNAPSGGNDIIVEISVNKPGIDGFIKYFQELPAGYVATDIDSKGGNFTNADNGAKIVWTSPPADQFVISYKITPPSGAQASLSIGGKFSYIVGNERKTFELTPVSMGNNSSINSGSVSSGTTPPKEAAKENPEPKTDKPVIPENKQPEEKPKPVEVKKETPVITPPSNKVPTTATPASNSGKSYKVQIGAFSAQPKIDGVPEQSKLVLENGVTKYFSGNFKTYEEAAKRKKEMIEKGFPGAFVVSFENGKIVK
jgi:hypothetical protein